MTKFNKIAELLVSGDIDGAAEALVSGAVEKLSEGGSNYKTYHASYTDAISEALRLATEDGYTVDEDEYFTKVASGPRKPVPGETNRFVLELFKDGKKVKETLSFQIYGMEEGKFELNAYIW